MDSFVPFASRAYFLLFALLLLSRGLDFLSTWIATPNLELEANPIARKLGWRGSIVLNVAVCSVFAMWLLPAIVIITASVLVAARNFQSAWIMRSMGEPCYRAWLTERLSESKPGLFVFCLFAQGGLFACLGIALIQFSDFKPVPFGIGTGVIAYAVLVVFFSLLAVWRVWRKSSADF
ncbi:MAG: hypothetical protein N3G20_06555 [Verrucomicrobiae bacterium]|nr:hypothetical protein [Verrucomicrobiae bacterium]